MGELFICRSRIDAKKTMIRDCWNCKKRRKMFGWFQEWYGWHVTCLGCGEQWQDGEHIERPFRPGWRKENINHAKELMAKLQSPATT